MVDRAALVSVSNKSGLEQIAKAVHEAGYTILASGGTAAYIHEHGLPVLPVEEYTGQKELLDGRVKTLHPKIHAGILARRDNPDDLAQLESAGAMQIDLVICNLYPFEEQLEQNAGRSFDEMIEYIDIGGPSLLRAAAKNHKWVWVVTDPVDYSKVADHLKEPDSSSAGSVRLALATKVYELTSHYDSLINNYLVGQAEAESQGSFPERKTLALTRAEVLRYGENPHQEAALYREPGFTVDWVQHGGKALSYNNWLDLSAAHAAIAGFADEKPCALVVKHLNPCGAARGKDLVEALKRARECDPRSHFGGIIAFNQRVELPAAQAVRESFTEIVLAPEFSPEALAEFGKSKNLRVLEVGLGERPAFELRSVLGGVLMQGVDSSVCAVDEAELVTSRTLSDQERRDLEFAWSICSHIRSNAVCVIKDEMTLAVGGGQMSRIDAVEIGLLKAKTHGHSLEGAVAASDAFFPFEDGIEALANVGVVAIITPRGAKRDPEVSKRADELGVSLVYASERHFRH